jgi:fatty-acyl-CoA synthase
MSLRNQAARPSVADLVLRTAKSDGARVALVYEQRTWTYRGLVDEATRVAGGLRGLGLAQGDRVASFGHNSDRYVVTWLATVLAGAIHVPINYMLGSGEVGYVLRHSGARTVFCDGELATIMNGATAQLDDQPAVISMRGATQAGWMPYEAVSGDGSALDTEIDLSDIAQIAYTSGTEAAPKGAMLSHGALISQYTSCIVAGSYRGDDVVLNSSPLYHCAQMHCFLMPYLWLGAQNILLAKAEPGAMIAAAERFGVTSIFAPPTVWIGILRHRDFSPDRLKTLRKGFYGASIMPIEIVRELADRLPQIDLYNYYGQTELCPLATCLPPEDQLRRPGSAGRPVLNVETRVVDEQMRPVSVGDVGEIVHRSPQLLTGYFRDEAKTAAAFEGGWFHSGDLATIDDEGYITIVDRKKDMIVSGGENVSSREVEEVLYQHPAVNEVAVVAVADPRWIEAVCAVVVPRDGETIDQEELIGFARARLARFKVPKRVVVRDSLPKNPSGKVLKRELRDDLAATAMPIAGGSTDPG